MLLRTLLFYIPSVFITSYAILGLMKFAFSIKSLWLLSAIVGVSLTLVRDVFLLYGLHTVLVSLVYIGCAYFLLRLPVHIALLARALSLFLVMAGEVLITKTIIDLLRIDIQQVFANPFLHMAVGWISYSHVIILVVYVYAVRHKAVYLEKRSG